MSKMPPSRPARAGIGRCIPALVAAYTCTPLGRSDLAPVVIPGGEIVIRPEDGNAILGHEIRHVFDGHWHPY